MSWSDTLNQKAAFWRHSAARYKATIDQTGALPRSDWWRYEYCQTPYLMLASDEYLAQRWLDQYHINVRLTAAGQIAPREDFADEKGMFGPLFSHLTMEFGTRGGVPAKLISDGNAMMNRYFEKGEPTGVRLFQGYPETLDGVIVKFGQREHIEKMLNNGEVRVTPSTFYSQASLSKAMHDLESERQFHHPTFDAVRAGRSCAKTKSGFEGAIEDGFIKETVRCPDYVLWCACRDIDRRMPDDFNADAALIIRKPAVFASRFESGLKKLWPGVKIKVGPVRYYDPCSFVHRNERPVHLKHFQFAYQREWRLCAFPTARQMPAAAFNIELGALSDIAEMVALPA
ncbi:hypothetical protein ACC817_22665 [Rhizobium ruizarguesonis]